VHKALAGDRMVLFLMQKNDADDPQPDDLHRIGTVGIVRQMATGAQGLRLPVEGVARVPADFLPRHGDLVKALIR